MTMRIKDHAGMLGIRSKTISKLRAINIVTLEDLSNASIDKIKIKLECTSDRALVLINRAKRAVSAKSVPHDGRATRAD